MRHLGYPLKTLFSYESFSLLLAGVTRLFFVFLVIFLFFNVRYECVASCSYILGEKKDFTIIFLYISDIILFLLCLCAIFVYIQKHRGLTTWNWREYGLFGPLSLLILALVSYLIRFEKLTLPIISLYYLLYLTKGIVLHETIKSFGYKLYGTFSRVFLVLLALVSLLSIYQFANQTDLGLQVLGESVVGPYGWGVAKVEALGQFFLRSYGTFPHPNILGAFLVLGILCAVGNTLENSKNHHRIRCLGGILLINLYIFALFLTFSRAAWLGAAVGLSLFID